ncbi:TPA: hypothetical protein L4G98_003984 [Pseudomonas aeruginosa]|nr:hypothetical protein [Pseudomonas aeruginosa]
MSKELNKALELLREIRPSIPKDVLELWCKDRDAFLAQRSEFHQHLKECADEVATWPTYKREALGPFLGHELGIEGETETANELNKAPVGQAGGDERTAFNAWLNEVTYEENTDRGVFMVQRHQTLSVEDERIAWRAWQGRALLARSEQEETERLREAYEWGYGDGQNNPNGYSDKKERDACVNELLKQHSPAQPEGAPVIGCLCGMPMTEGHHSPDGCCNLEEFAPQAQADQAEAERTEVVARVAHSNPVVLDQCAPLNANDELMTVAQHAASVARWAEMFNRVEQERDAALARVAELEAALSSALSQHGVKFMDPPDGGDTPLIEQVYRMSQALSELEKREPAGVPMPDEIHQMAFEEGQPADDGDGYLFSAEEFDLFVQRLLDSCAAPVAQAQHSVPDGAADLCRFLAKLYCELDGLRYSTAKLPAEQIADALIFKWPVLQGARNQLNIKRISEQPYDESKLHSAIAAMLAAAPGKEGV